MRSCKALPLLLSMAAFTLFAQERTIPSNTLGLDGLSIPVEVNSTIKAEKLHPGDTVRLQMAEPILVGRYLVIPGNAKVYGHVLGARSAAKDTDSRLAIVADRVEWKDHVLPLHAVVAGFAFHRNTPEAIEVECGERNPQFPNNGGRPGFFPDSFGWLRSCNDKEPVKSISEEARSRSLAGILIYRSAYNEYTVLVSKRNIHLPSGLILMMMNQVETQAITGK